MAHAASDAHPTGLNLTPGRKVLVPSTRIEELSLALRFTTPLAIDRTIKLNVNGSTQNVRICAARAGFAPLLVVQTNLP